MTDESGCTAQASFTVDGPAPILANAGSEAVSGPDQNDGVAFVSPSGGSGNFAVQWENGSFSDTIKNLSIGDYAYTITDANFCEITGSVSVTPCTVSALINAEPASCDNALDGKITISTPDGSPDFEISWGDSSSINIRTELAPGDYAVTLTEANGCTSVANISIEVEDLEAPQIDTSQELTLFLDESGQINIDTTLLNSLISDNCSNAPKVSFDILNLDCSLIGTQKISVVVQDDSGNMRTADFSVSIRRSIAPSISCPENIVVAACVVNYELPTVEDNCTANAPELLSGIASGMEFPEGVTPIDFKVSDTSGNEANCSFTVTNNGSTDPPIVLNDPIIMGTSDDSPNSGRIEISFTGGGDGPFQFEWFDESGNLIGDSLVLENVNAGNYTLTITNQSTGCSLTSNLFLVSDTETFDFVERLETFPNPSQDQFS